MPFIIPTSPEATWHENFTHGNFAATGAGSGLTLEQKRLIYSAIT